MKVDSHNIEFGYELLSAVPYAYELYLRGELDGTRSGYDTEALYYFSPKHEINMAQRSWFNTEVARREGLPYTVIHKPEQPDKIFPPYKEYYANDEYKFKKPTLCICNRYNIEWGVRAINYFNEEILEWMFSTLEKQYEVVYFPVSISSEFYDGVEPITLDDIAIARKHKVTLFTDLCKGKSWNETMLKVFANCEHYITMNGGYSILASFFSGTNIIYSVPGSVETKELKQGSFWRWYPNINNVRTLHTPSHEALKEKIEALYVKKMPCVNILIRTHRTNYLRRCMETVRKQDYPNINIVLICDSDEAVVATREYPARVIRVEKVAFTEKNVEGIDYGVFFPYNRYIETVQRLVNGFIIVLDDDDKFTRSDSVSVIMSKAKKNALMLWRVDFNKDGVKPSFSFGKEVTLFDVTGIGMCYHTDHIELTDWNEWKRGDYRTARNLSGKLETIWIDEVLTGLQDRLGMGVKADLPSAPQYITVKLTYPEGRVIIQIFTHQEIECYEPIFKNQGICIEQMI